MRAAEIQRCSVYRMIASASFWSSVQLGFADVFMEAYADGFSVFDIEKERSDNESN